MTRPWTQLPTHPETKTRKMLKMCQWHNDKTQSHETPVPQVECRGNFHRFEFHSYSQSIGPRSWNPQMRAADTGIEQCCRPVKWEGVAEHPKEPALTPSREIPPLSSIPIESGRRTGAESIQRRQTDRQQASVDALNHQPLEIWKPRPQRSISSHPAGRPQWGLGRWTSS